MPERARAAAVADDLFGARAARAAAETAAARSGAFGAGAHERLVGLVRPADGSLKDTKSH